MSISFRQIPTNIRVPGAYIEIDAREAFGGLSASPKRAVVFAQKLSTGTAVALVPTMVTSYAQALELGGAGSLAGEMAEALFANESFIEKWFVFMADPTGTAAHGHMVFTGPATEAGAVYLYVNGNRIVVPVSIADTMDEVGVAIAAAINGLTELPVTAAFVAETDTLTVTAKHVGTIGNTIDVRLNWLGEENGEVLPTGITTDVAKVVMADGVGDVDLTDAFASLPDEKYDIIVSPYTDATNLGILEDAMDLHWGPLVKTDGICLLAKKDTVSNLSSFGNAHNSPYVCCLDAGKDNPTPAYLWVSALAGQVLAGIDRDPALPFTGLELRGVIADKPENRRTTSERNILLYDGVATHRIARDGSVQIERLVTMYQYNEAGASDPAYLDVNTPFTLSYIRETTNNRILTRFSRYKLADTLVPGAGDIVTPKIIRAELIDLASQWVQMGLVENIEQFKTGLIVERNANDRTRVDVKMPPDLVNQFYIFAATIMFRL